MIKFCIQQWDKNRNELEKQFKEMGREDKDFNYEDLMKRITNVILNDSDGAGYSERFDADNITEINDGDYQGTMLYMIPRKTYQPSESDYLLTFVNYGSCSGCDALEAAQMESGEEFVKEMMDLSLHIIQNMVKPYNNGWRNEELFEEVKVDEPE